MNDGATGRPIDTLSASSTRQLDYYRSQSVTSTSNAKLAKKYGEESLSWWLRTPYSTTTNCFIAIASNGGWSLASANSNNGLSPAFRLG